MEFKCKTEVKVEELDLEYESYQQNSQIFPSNEVSFTLAEGIKNEELDEKTFIKSELRETEKEYIYCSQNLKKLLGDVGEAEKGSKMKSISKSRPQSSVTCDQSLEESHLEKLSYRFRNFSFKDQAELKIHLKTHEKRKFKCDHCSYEGNSTDLFKRHLIIHSNVKLFKCSECRYKCSHKGNLKKHMLIHGNVKLFKCSKCTYECNDIRHLKTHLLIHENGCKDKSNLKSHMLTHGNVKLFKCSECSYACNVISRLRRHMITHG